MKYGKILSAFIVTMAIGVSGLASTGIEQAENAAQQKYLEAIYENGNLTRQTTI